MKPRSWNWWEILLWAYSTIVSIFYIFAFVSLAVMPQVPHMVYPHVSTHIIGLILVIPLFIFLIREGIKNLKDR